MKFKDFVKWCNERACDGCWGMTEVIICTSIIKEVRKLPLWKRKKKWDEFEEEIVQRVVEPINKKILEMCGGNL